MRIKVASTSGDEAGVMSNKGAVFNVPLAEPRWTYVLAEEVDAPPDEVFAFLIRPKAPLDLRSGAVDYKVLPDSKLPPSEYSKDHQPPLAAAEGVQG